MNQGGRGDGGRTETERESAGGGGGVTRRHPDRSPSHHYCSSEMSSECGSRVGGRLWADAGPESRSDRRRGASMIFLSIEKQKRKKSCVGQT
jgi:hypothetical protein